MPARVLFYFCLNHKCLNETILINQAVIWKWLMWSLKLGQFKQQFITRLLLDYLFFLIYHHLRHLYCCFFLLSLALTLHPMTFDSKEITYPFFFSLYFPFLFFPGLKVVGWMLLKITYTQVICMIWIRSSENRFKRVINLSGNTHYFPLVNIDTLFGLNSPTPNTVFASFCATLMLRTKYISVYISVQELPELILY